MFLAQIESYDLYSWLTKLSPENYAEVRKQFPRLQLPEDQSKITYYGLNCVLASDEIEYMCSLGLEPRIRMIRGLYYGGVQSHRSGASLGEAIGQAENAGNTVYNISVPNVGLLAVQRVAVLEDCCTDVLQSHLDKGWRILAVCPPNDQRRPDYIVGHSDPNAS